MPRREPSSIDIVNTLIWPTMLPARLNNPRRAMNPSGDWVRCPSKECPDYSKRHREHGPPLISRPNGNGCHETDDQPEQKPFIHHAHLDWCWRNPCLAVTTEVIQAAINVRKAGLRDPHSGGQLAEWRIAFTVTRAIGCSEGWCRFRWMFSEPQSFREEPPCDWCLCSEIEESNFFR